MGKNALYSNTSGSRNTANGYFALYYNTSGSYNTANGYYALKSNITGDYNTANGYYALSSNITGNYNTANGCNALNSNTTAIYNTANGYHALYTNTTGNHNTAMGANSLFNSTGERNTANGYYSLNSNTTGSYNTSLGYRSGYDNTTGTYNTFLGYNARTNNNTAKTNSTAVGNDAVITASNQVRIGNASVTSIGGYEPWTDLSDGRFKINVMEDIYGLDFIMALRPVSYNLDINKLNEFLGVEKESVDQKAVVEKSSVRQSGFIAQEVDDAAKKIGWDFSGVDVPKNEGDHYGLRYAKFVVPLVKAVQDQQKMIE